MSPDQDDDVQDELNSRGLASVGDVYEQLKDKDDDEIIRLVYAYNAGENVDGMSSLTSQSMATFMLRERGYSVDRVDGDVQVRTDDGDVIDPSDL